MLDRWTFLLSKESFKFAAAHVTVFPEGRKERLHGHNYRVRVALDARVGTLAEMIDFNILKKYVRQLCDEWDEHVLLPTEGETCRMTEQEDSIEAVILGDRYVFPKTDVAQVATDNITVESLSRDLARRLWSYLVEHQLAEGPEDKPGIVGLKITVEETDGQAVSYRYAGQGS